MIKRCSSSYTNIKDNFVILLDDNLTDKKTEDFQNSVEYGIFCVVQNIIQRGKPTEPSNYLKKVIGQNNDDTCTRLISNIPAKWSQSTIKGDDYNSYNPANHFFNVYLPVFLDDLGEYGFVRNLIIPEADFNEVVGEETKFIGQKVDFFLPAISTVIEIDGGSHANDIQASKDHNRDRELGKHRISVLRIKTADYEANTGSFQSSIRLLGKRIRNSRIIAEYKEAVENKPSKESCSMEAVIRFQMLLLTCIMEQILDLNQSIWHISVLSSDIPDAESILEKAYHDLQIWADSIAGLLKCDLVLPQIVFVDKDEPTDLSIDISLFERYDETDIPRGNSVIIRTNYYPDNNYYKVAVSKTLKYNISLADQSDDIRKMEYLLQNIFGFSEFQTGQARIIANILNGNDTIGVLPTGAGKSLCYQFSAMLEPGVTVIVDPIISLMQDQMRSMAMLGIVHNEMISSLITGEGRGKVMNAFQNRAYQMIWISPERFQNQEFRESLGGFNQELNICLTVIDEVHCLSEWGHDFRVSYLTLVRTFRVCCPNAILVGLTATASEFALLDIRAEFGKEEPLDLANVITIPSMGRKELTFKRIEVSTNAHRNEILESIINSKRTSEHIENGLVFCPTIGGDFGCEKVAGNIRSLPEWEGKIRVFYGRMNQRQKEINQRDFMDGKFPLMVCTKAFGMGVDKRDLRYTIHYTLPASVESFYQEAGRAGRDHHKSDCYILYNVDKRVRNTVNYLSSRSDLLELLQCKDDDYKRIFGYTDFGTTLFFIRSSYMGEVNECRYIESLLKDIFETPNIQFHQVDTEEGRNDYYYKQKIENALYKLSILGFVKDWTVHYDNLVKGMIVVDVVGEEELSADIVLENFLTYVRKYDVEFSLEAKEGKLYSDIWNQSEAKVSNVIQMLVRWTDQNILYQRLQCSKNMMDWCDPEVNDETFRRNMEGYFRFDDVTERFEHIAKNPSDWHEWFETLYEHSPKTKRRMRRYSNMRLQENAAGLKRFLESYQNNTGFNYLDGLLLLLTSQKPTRQDLARMERSLESIKAFDPDDQRGILLATLHHGRTIESMDTKDLLGQVLLDHFPTELNIISEQLEDRYSLLLRLKGFTNRLENIRWIT